MWPCAQARGSGPIYNTPQNVGHLGSNYHCNHSLCRRPNPCLALAENDTESVFASVGHYHSSGQHVAHSREMTR